MKRICRRTTLLLALPIISSCGTFLNTFYDEHQTFVDTRNSEIGKNIDKVLSTSGRPTEQDFLEIVRVDEDTLEYRFETPTCAWAISADASTKKIDDWRFLGDSSGCTYKRFYEGPW